MDDIEDIEEGFEKIEKKDGRGGRREGSGRKPSIEKIRDEERRRLDAEFWVQAAETFGPSFIDVVMNDDVPWEVRFKTWQEINNRAYGKAKEIKDVKISGIGSLTDLFTHATNSPEATE